MKTPASSRTTWWWAQKVMAALGTLALAGWLWCFIKAATMDTAVLSLSVVSPQGVAATLREIGGGEKPKDADAAKSVPVPTIRTQAGQDYRLEALTAPTFDALPPAVARRMEWGCFMLGGDGKWWKVPIAEGTGRKTSCVLRTREPGVYMVLAALPPVTLERLGGRPSSYAQGFLASDMPSRRCRAIQIVVEGKPAANAAQPVPPESAGAIVELSRPRNGGQPPAPPPPQEPPPQPEKEAEPAKTNAQQTATEQPALTPKDMEHAGTDPQGAVSTREPKSENTRSIQPDSHVARVPPCVPAVASLVVSNATLPAMELDCMRAEIAQLDFSTWDAICKEHVMPFVAVPDAEYSKDYDGNWIVMMTDGAKKKMKPKEINALFGLQYLELSALSKDVQLAIRDRFADAGDWYRCSEQRGFLLNNLLLDAVNAALRERLDITSADRIKLLAVSISVNRDSGTPKIVTTVNSIKMKE